MNTGIKAVLSRAERVFTANSPIVLTAFGVVGIVGTVYATHKATTTANKKVADAIYTHNLTASSLERIEGLTRMETAKLVWKDYAPVVGIASLSVAAVIGAQYVNTKRAAALAAGYMVIEAKHEEYREKVEEIFGVKKAQDVDSAVNKGQIERARDRTVTVHTGDVLCIDTLTGQPFSSNMEDLRRAQNDINNDILHGETPSVTDLYAKLEGSGLKATRVTDVLGWNDESMCEMKLTSELDEKGLAYLVMDFSILPKVHFYKKTPAGGR